MFQPKGKRSGSAREAAMDRIRAAVGTTIGIPPEAALSDEMIASAVERICRSCASVVPGLAALARDLETHEIDAVEKKRHEAEE